MPANLHEYLSNENLKNNKFDENQDEHNKISTLLSDLASVLEEKTRLESDYCYLKLEYGSLIDEMERKTSNYQNEKACLMQHLEELENEIKLRDLRETRFKERENTFYHEKKMYTTQIDNLKKEIQNEKLERNNLEKKLLDEMKILHNQLKSVILDWIKTKDTCSKFHKKFTNHKTSRDPKIKSKIDEKLQCKIDNKSSQTYPLSDQNIAKGLQCKSNHESNILEELFFKRKPFEHL